VIAALDSSVLARVLLGEPQPLREWSQIREAYASRLLPLEMGRLIDRLRLAGKIDDQQVADLQEELGRVMTSISIVGLTESILIRATGPMPTTLGSLDAIHLASALAVQQSLGSPITFATHDAQLARAARASGLAVRGV